MSLHLFIFFALILTLYPQRPDIPAVIQQATTSSQMDISTWGIPTASYPNSTCAMESFFPPQQLVLLTTLCGVWYVQKGNPFIISFTNLKKKCFWYKGLEYHRFTRRPVKHLLALVYVVSPSPFVLKKFITKYN